MKPSLIPAEQASRFYRHWLNADREKRESEIQSLIHSPLHRLDLPALLQHEIGNGYSLPRAMRRIRNLLICAIIERDLSGKADLSEVVETMTLFAEFAIRTHLDSLYEELTETHGTPVGAHSGKKQKMIVLGMGKLGGKELGYASDLDLIFLYDDDHPDAPMLYTRLAQRFITWMTSPTSAGILFDIDVALRPDGASGLMVSSFESFERYQNESAWAWEHQALTRARFCAGDETIGNRFEALRNRILRQQRPPAWLKEEILKMRQRIHDAHPNHSGLFDLKHDAGGMIDIEFIVQYLVLEYSRQYPELTENFGNIALLKMSEKLGLVPKESGEKVSAIYRLFRKWQHQIRMQGADQAKVKPERATEQSNEVKKLWKQVFGQPSN